MELIFEEESYRIRGAAQAVYNILGSGFVEPVYQEALEIEFHRRNIPYKREVEIEVYYDGILLQKKFRADFICFDKIIVETKAVSSLDDANVIQLSNYLKATQMKLGFLINFGHSGGIEIKRWVN